jgi:chorismate mutase / prephenate dehydratase
MSDIADLRGRIDALDNELIRILNERAAVAKEIGALKHRDGMPIYSPERENRILRGLVERSKGPLGPDSIRAIYREIMSASLALEKDIAIACVGPSGSLTHQAARDKFGSSVRYALLQGVEAVFEEVKAHDADCGVVPIEEPGHGVVSATLDALAETELSVCGEITIPGDPGDESRSAARLLVIGKTANSPTGCDSTMLMLRIENKPGSLVVALEPFKTHEINLNHFASRPASKGSKDIFFFVEADGHSRELQMSDVFRDLSMRCRAVKMLGSYPRRPVD